jgi:adenylate cyclase
MALEIERKFLTKGDFKSHSIASYTIAQGYLSSVPERTVRVRIKGNKGFITVKGIGSDSGTTRYEWEKEVPVDEIKELLKICEPGVINKTRYLVPSGQHIFEVDIFEGDNKGLVVAEIELKTEDEVFDRPEWLGEEVTGDRRYYNAMLAKQPYRSWNT